MNPPTLSVIMPVYNKASELPKGLELILNQSFQPKEIIIVDDGSTDNSFEIIESFAQKYPIIQAYKNEKNHNYSNTLVFWPIVVIAVNENINEFQWFHLSQSSRGNGWNTSSHGIWVESFIMWLKFSFVYFNLKLNYF